MSHDHFGGEIAATIDGEQVTVRYLLRSSGAKVDAVITADGGEIGPGFFDRATVQELTRECEGQRVVAGWPLP